MTCALLCAAGTVQPPILICAMLIQLFCTMLTQLFCTMLTQGSLLSSFMPCWHSPILCAAGTGQPPVLFRAMPTQLLCALLTQLLCALLCAANKGQPPILVHAMPTQPSFVHCLHRATSYSRLCDGDTTILCAADTALSC